MTDAPLPDHAQASNEGGVRPSSEPGRTGSTVMDPREASVPMSEPEVTMEPTSLNVDVLDRDDEIVVIADLPGFDEDDIEIRFTDAGLRIEGAEEENEKEISGTYLVRERPRSWTRTVHLPDTVERDGASVESTEFTNGTLTITVRQSGIADQRIEI